MFSTMTSKALLALTSLTGALALLDKPIANPAVPFDHMDDILFQHLPSTPSHYDQWEWGWLPARCKAVAEDRGLNPYDLNVYNVHYDDCDTAWVFCRHHDAQVSLDQMIDNFGRMPVRLRNMVRVQIGVPGDGLMAYTYSDLGDVVYTGDIGPYVRFWIHEAGHVIDRREVFEQGDYSSTDAWLNEYNKDAFVCDAYAQTNNAENFAQEVIVALFDKVVPGGIGSLVPNWNDIFHQYATVQAVAGDRIIPGGTCNRFFEDDYIVCMGPAAGCESSKRDVEIVEAYSEPPKVCKLQ
ncbi:hypothetical protein BJY04DRAFT_20791 [Aspergillus karnatakaensis]|uniref:uncharacterized protein n=1 Tax=Aspergillus karnatakaensis TaxID=1810916 RepID=UPI003CCCFB85